jgi:hypothetical protein
MESRVRCSEGHIGSRIAWATLCFPALQESPDETRPPRTLARFFDYRPPPPKWPNDACVALWLVPNIEFFALDEKVPPGLGGNRGPLPGALGQTQNKSCVLLSTEVWCRVLS